MSIEKPKNEEVKNIIGENAFKAWEEIEKFMFDSYDMDERNTLWNIEKRTGGYEYKFRKSSRTLITLYTRENYFGFMIIFGAKEREIFESMRHEFSEGITAVYDEAKTYHDGKWMMFDTYNDKYIEEYKRLIKIKRKPLSR